MLQLLLITVDPSLGRFDVKSLPDQALMELLFTDMDETFLSEVQDENKEFKDVSEWKDVGCTDCRVTAIDLSHEKFIGEQFPFPLIPPLMKSFAVRGCNLQGTLDASVLPLELYLLNLSNNRLQGEINWKALPRKLERLIIFTNDFHGSCVFADLPHTLITLYAGQNRLSGGIELKNLPEAMRFLDMSNNELRGSITFEGPPQSLKDLDLRDNGFTGDLRVLDKPPNLVTLKVAGNKLSGTVVIQAARGKLPKWLRFLCYRAVVDFDGNTIA